ncbi:MAG TPA: hypothetical protein VKU03_13610, partial [Roseiarcus sp.]|nr:hypothetical protein [Roseiarcus sp.]
MEKRESTVVTIAPVRMCGTTIRVYRYGLAPPLDWDDECDAEMARLDRFYNALVEIEEAAQAEYRRLSSSDETALLETRIAAAEEAKDWGAAKALRAALKEIRAALRKANAAAIDAAEEKRKADAKAARQNCGAYWSSYNAVIRSVELARQKAIKEGAAFGKRTHEPGKGDWRMTVQIQGGASVADVLGGKNSQLRIAAPAHFGALRDRPAGMSRKACRHGRVTMVVHNTGGLRRVTWPLMMHRPIPPEAIIVGAEIVKRRRLGSRWDDWHLCVTVREPAPAPHESPDCAGVNIGWRRLSVERGLVVDGAGLRIAMIWDGATLNHVILPEEIISAAWRCDELTSAIDKRVDAATARIFKDSPDHPVARQLGDTFVESGRLRVRDLWTFANAMTPAPDWLLAMLRACSRDRRERAGLLRRMARRRRDIYRVAAKTIAENYGRIAICAVDWAKLARLRESGKDNPLPPPARGYRKIAAPGEFEAELRRAMKARGATIMDIKDSVSFLCHACGKEHAPSERSAAHHTCPSCGATWDQDR